MDAWKVAHTPGGVDGWTAQIAAADPAVVVMGGWTAPTSFEMQAWLRTHGYRRVFVGRWRTFVDEAAYARARRRGVFLPQIRRYRSPPARAAPSCPLPCAWQGR